MSLCFKSIFHVACEQNYLLLHVKVYRKDSTYFISEIALNILPLCVAEPYLLFECFIQWRVISRNPRLATCTRNFVINVLIKLMWPQYNQFYHFTDPRMLSPFHQPMFKIIFEDKMYCIMLFFTYI